MLKKFISGLLIIGAGCLFADNITSSARVIIDSIAINKGTELKNLLPLNGAPWYEQQPFSGKERVEIFFEGAEMPLISKVKCDQFTDRLAEGYLEYFDGKEWIKAPPLKKIETPRGVIADVNIEFNPPVKARAMRLNVLKTIDLDHEVLRLGNWQINGRTADKRIAFGDSMVTLSTAVPFNTFEMPEPAVIKVDVENKAKEKRNLKVVAVIQSFFGYPVDTPPIGKLLSLASGEKTSFNIAFAAKEQGPYRVDVRIFDNDHNALLDSSRLAFGVRDPEVFKKSIVTPLDKPGSPVKTWRGRIQERGTIWGADVTQGMSGNGRTPGDLIFKTLKEAGGTEVYCALAYHDFEPMPGVYNFAYFDSVVKSAQNNNLDITLGVWIWDFQGPSQQFLKDEIKRDVNGKSSNGWDGSFSLFSTKFRKHAHQAMTALVKRYINSPAVIGWHLHPYGIVDHDEHGILDYHPDAIAAYRKFLANKFGNIAALNKAYGTSYESWSQINPPRPAWEAAMQKGDYDLASRMLQAGPEWVDWLEFFHGGSLGMREEMMKIVRDNDRIRMICGINASGGVGLADANYQALILKDALYGDQGLNGAEIIRRFVAKQRYNRSLRCEDINCVTLGRAPFMTKESLIVRSNWDVYQSCVLGLEHFNYVFPTLDDNVFFDLVYANPKAKSMVNEARESRFAKRPIGLLHSFVTDVLEGKYTYNGISIYRWWLMNGLSAAFYNPGNYFEIYSDGAPLDGFDKMKLVIDDGSHVLPYPMVDELVEYVKNGGKLALICGPAGEKTPRSSEEHILLKKLGYTAIDKLKNVNKEVAQLVFLKDNPVLRKTVNIPINNYCELEVPKNGTLVGRVGAVPAAVAWKLGKGEVFLIGGRPGSVREAEVMELFEKKAADKAWALWANAVRDSEAISKSLLTDLAEWAEVPPLMSIDGDIFAVLREACGNKYLVYMYNHGPELVPVLRMNLPADSKWKVTALSLDGETALGTFSGQAITAPGVALPKLKHDRFLCVRLERRNGVFLWIF